MKRSISRWTTALAAAAVLTAPAAAMAQTGTGQPPTGTSGSATTAQPPAGTQANADQARQHLTAARNSLSELAQLPAAAQLSGDARNQISQLITNFNELITAPTNWRASYAKVEQNLTALVGDAKTDEGAARTTGVAGAVGTSGIANSLDPTIKAKLVEFRGHLDKFEEAAGGGAADPSAAGASAAGTSASGTATSSATGTSATGAATGSTAGTAAGTTATDPASAQAQESVDKDALLRHVQAIESILRIDASAVAGTSGTSGTTGTGTTATAGTTGTQSPVTITPEQFEQLRNHLAEMRRLIELHKR